MNILLDMNISPEWKSAFMESGFVCRHWSEIGSVSAKDVEIFTWAAQNKFVVFTNDLDFGAILAATNAAFPSVIQLRSNRFFPDDVKHVALLTGYLKMYQQPLNKGALVTIDVHRAKVRILPLKN
jgi:predicted nuclease of predicted toxin-antitoxin system